MFVFNIETVSPRANFPSGRLKICCARDDLADLAYMLQLSTDVKEFTVSNGEQYIDAAYFEFDENMLSKWTPMEGEYD